MTDSASSRSPSSWSSAVRPSASDVTRGLLLGLLVFIAGCSLCPDRYVFEVKVALAPDVPARGVEVLIDCRRVDGVTARGTGTTSDFGTALVSLPAEQRCAAVHRRFADDVAECLFVLTREREDGVKDSVTRRYTGAELDGFVPDGREESQLVAEVLFSFPE